MLLFAQDYSGPLAQSFRELTAPPGPLAQAGGGDFGGRKGLAPPPVLDDSTAPDRPSLGMALMYSALLPGLGENYLDRRDRAFPFWVAEGALWSAFAGFTLYGGWAKTDYLAYAGTAAGADVNGKPEEYLQAMMTYVNRDEYNLNIVYQSRKVDKRFPETDDWNWHWNSHEEQKAYIDLRNRSDKAYQGARTVVAFMIVNRLLSLLDTAVLYRTRNRPTGFGLRIDGGLDRVNMSLTKSF